MAHLRYMAVLLFIALCGFDVNFFFKVKITRLWRAFLLTDICIVISYLLWDYWAIVKGNWYFDQRQILTIHLLPKVPLEELLFFIVVPLTTIITYQALLKLTGWEKSRK